MGGGGRATGRAIRWRPATAWAAVLVGACGLAARGLVRDGGDPRLAVVVALIAVNLAVVAVALLFAALHGRPSASDFGLCAPPLHRAVLFTGVVVVSMVVVTGVLVAALGADDEAPDITDRLAAGRGGLNAFLVLVLVAVATPLAEEFLFRGYFFRTLSNRWALWPSALVTGAVFAAFHLGWLPAAGVAVAGYFGVASCLLYHWTGSLYPPLALHALVNSTGISTAVGSRWQVPIAIAAAVAATLSLGWTIGRFLDSGHPS